MANVNRGAPRCVGRSILAVVVIALMLALAGGASAEDGLQVAHLARTLNVTDEARLHYHESAGSSLIEEGRATGGLPGAVKVHFTVGPTVSATFTISTRSGTLIGHGSGVLHSSGTYASFRGSMSITRGTGRYVHAHGHGGFYGVLNRKTYALTVQTTGSLSY
jgi:hypothetical protein